MGLTSTILEWSSRTRRDLPWRRTRDPWAVLVSELMLQQTQVSRVIPRYEEFVQRFPDPEACASAPVGAVVEAWAGLGYNRRAVNLHRTASQVVERHGGRLPGSLDELLALPGIGPYTARAVLAFAYEKQVGVVDTNAARVLARAVAGRRLTLGEVQAHADRLVPAERSWEWNQAMLDLGATVCTARSPRCDVCPLSGSLTGRRRSLCAWSVAGRPDPDPAVGSAGTSGRQSTFAGSDRQGRGRLVSALRQGSVKWDAIASAAGWPDDPARGERVAATLVADGLAVATDLGLTLP
jgi:A/G-specific adenine glycosylase